MGKNRKKHHSILQSCLNSAIALAMFLSPIATIVAEDTGMPASTEAPAESAAPAEPVTEEPVITTAAPAEEAPAEEQAPAEETAPVQEAAPAPTPAATPAPAPAATPAPTPAAVSEPTAVPAEAPEASAVPVVEETPAPAESAAPVETAEAAAPEATMIPEPSATPEATAASEPEYLPAGSFTGSTSQMTVTVSYGENTFRTGTEMKVAYVSRSEAIAAAEQTASEDQEVIDAMAVDITFTDSNGNEVQPEGAVSVSLEPRRALASTETSTQEVLHKEDNGNVQVVGNADVSAAGAEFSADHFSIYVISSKDTPAIATYIFHDAYGNQIGDVQKVKDGETVYAPTTPEKAGSKFIGWSGNKDATELQAGDPGNFTQITASVSTTDDVKLYPVFQQAYYVFFLDNQGRVSTTKEGVSEETISVTDVTIPLDSTHSVTGWYTDAELTNKVEFVKLSDHNVTLYPKVEEGHYLYFSSGEGASYVKPVFVAAGKNTVKPEAPTRPGYTFKYWSVSEDDSEYAFGSAISEDTTLYAVWEASTNTKYTVIYWWENANDSNYSYHENIVKTGTSGNKIDLAGISGSYDGFTLNTEKTNAANADAVIAGDGSTIVNVYYSRNTYEIKFFKGKLHRKLFGGSYYSWDEITGLSISAKYGTNISDRWPTNTSKIWGTNRGDNGQGAQPYQSGISTMPLGGASFYYVEQSGSFTMNLHYYLEGLDGRYYLHHTDSFKSDNYVWSTTKEDHYDIEGFTYTNNVEDGTRFSWNNGSRAYEVSFEYRRNDYFINFVNKDSTISKKFKYGADVSKVDLTAAPERPAGIPSGYVFAGWFDNELGVGDPATLTGKMPAHNITLYAKWAAPAYTGTVHMNLEGTGNPMQFTISYGSKINENDMPTVKDSDGNIIQEGSSSYTVTVPKGNTWAGWATKSGNDYIIYNFSTEVYSDIALYPYYINGEKYTVTYSLGEGKGTAPTDSKQYSQNAYADIQPASGIITPPEGMTFLYWSHGTDKYYPGDKVKITGNLELTAVYGDTSALTSITYHSNYPTESGLTDRTHVVDNQANNTAITLGKADFIAPAGYYFAYWMDASGKRYDVGTKIGIDNNRPANDLYAVWEQKKEITLTANSETFTYDGTEHTVSGVKTNTFTIDNVTYTVSGFTTENPKEKNAGTYTNNILNTDSIVVKNGETDVTYQFTVNTENGSLKITPKAVTVTANSMGKTYGTADPELTAAVSGTLDNDTVSYTLSRAEGEDVGTYAITPIGEASQGNYTVTYVPGTFTISKSGTLTLNANGYEGEYDGKSHAASASASVPEGTTISYQVGNGEWTTEAPSIKDVGEQTVSVKAENANYETASTTVTLTVNKRTVNLKSESASKQYDGTALTAPTVTVSGDGFVTGEVTNLKAVGTITDVGTEENRIAYDKKLGFKAGNYEITEHLGTLSILAADISDERRFEVESLNDLVYNGRDQAQEPDVTDKDSEKTLVKDKDYTLTFSEDVKNVGEVAVTVKGIGNYTGTVERTYRITPASILIVTPDAEKEFDGTPLTAAGTIEGLVNGETVSFAATGSQISVGNSENTYSLVWDGTASESNYTVEAKTGTLTVIAADISNADKFTVSQPEDVVYNGLEQKQPVTVERVKASAMNAVASFFSDLIGFIHADADDAVLLEGTDYTLAYSENLIDAGTVTITVTGIGNYTGTVERTYQIIPAPLTITTGSASKTYDGKALTNAEAHYEGLMTVRDSIIVTATGTQTAVGSSANGYAIDWGNTLKENYKVTEALGTLTVTPAPAPSTTPTPSTPAPTPYAPETGGETPYTPVTAAVPYTPYTGARTPYTPNTGRPYTPNTSDDGILRWFWMLGGSMILAAASYEALRKSGKH
ncbi:MAG: InlB B-repeat-containing protein [Anaerolactibacter massiliensis]|nr:InlB B-repeat-containing protein [Anaerolactibacter massiliensis]